MTIHVLGIKSRSISNHNWSWRWYNPSILVEIQLSSGTNIIFIPIYPTHHLLDPFYLLDILSCSTNLMSPTRSHITVEICGSSLYDWKKVKWRWRYLLIVCYRVCLELGNVQKLYSSFMVATTNRIGTRTNHLTLLFLYMIKIHIMQMEDLYTTHGMTSVPVVGHLCWVWFWEKYPSGFPE